jgi:hypothetical protein
MVRHTLIRKRDIKNTWVGIHTAEGATNDRSAVKLC